MAEKTVGKEICQNCGVVVRPDTLFCYNCGSSVAPAESNVNKADPLTVKDAAASRKTNLKTAASLQQKNKTVEKKTVEVVWEEPESAPNLWFLVVAFLLTIFAVGIFVAMLYVH